MELLQFEYFKKVAEARTLSEAAEQLHISQPSLSMTIHRFEDELQTKLFERQGRNIVLNKMGLTALKYTNEILETIDKLKEAASGDQTRHAMTIDLAVYTGSALFPSLLSGFKANHPGIIVRMTQHNEDATVHDETQFIITASMNRPYSKYTRIVLTTEDILLAVPLTHHLANRTSIKVAELQQLDLMMLSKNKSLRQTCNEFFSQAGIDPNVILETDDPAMLRNLISSGFGVSLVPEKTWGAYLGSRIKLLRISDIKFTRDLCMFVNTNALSTAGKQFRDYLKSYFGEI